MLQRLLAIAETGHAVTVGAVRRLHRAAVVSAKKRISRVYYRLTPYA